MDPVSQAVAGATFSQSFGGNRPGQKIAFVAGALSGMAADLDVFIGSSRDPLLFLEFHRQFTHSIVFMPAGALICALLLFPFLKQKCRFVQVYVMTLLGYASHGLLDACTSYGTQLFWPFSEVRIAWNIISIVDPLFTFPILVLLLLGVFSGKSRFAKMGLSYGLLYLSFGVLQHERAMDALHALAAERGHVVERATGKPTLGNLYLWKLIYEYDGRYYVDAVRLGVRPDYVEGESVASAVNTEPVAASAIQSRDVERFRWFSDGYIAHYRADPMVIGDIRYSLLPNSIEPLWGIQLKPSEPDQHVGYLVSRNLTTEKRLQFLSMLFHQVDP